MTYRMLHRTKTYDIVYDIIYDSDIVYDIVYYIVCTNGKNRLKTYYIVLYKDSVYDIVR